MDKYDLIAPHLEHHHPQNVERRLRERIEGLLLQHHQDSTELRALCAARDEARAELAALRARIDDAATVTMIGISPTAGYLGYTNPSGGFFESSFEDCPECPILGKRVALVPLDD